MAESQEIKGFPGSFSLPCYSRAFLRSGTLLSVQTLNNAVHNIDHPVPGEPSDAASFSSEQVKAGPCQYLDGRIGPSYENLTVLSFASALYIGPPIAAPSNCDYVTLSNRQTSQRISLCA